MQDQEPIDFSQYPTDPPPVENITLTFAEFIKGEKVGRQNLYIVWRDAKALYVGISTTSVWHRWFSGFSSHMARNVFRQWFGCSPIGEEVAKNTPQSLKWMIELRHYEVLHLHDEERRLIQELQPPFNSTYNH